MGLTKEQREITALKSKIKSLETENESLVSYNASIENENRDLKERLKNKNQTIENYQIELNKCREQDKMMENPNVQTVGFCLQMMNDTFAKISCPLTRPVVFKEFVANVIGNQQALVDHHILKARYDAQRLDESTNNLMDSKDFLSNISNKI